MPSLLDARVVPAAARRNGFGVAARVRRLP
jgi:hypothetical protein